MDILGGVNISPSAYLRIFLKCPSGTNQTCQSCILIVKPSIKSKSKFFWEKIKVNNRPVPQGVNITWIKNMEVQRGESIVSFPSLFTCVLIDIHISWKTVV